MMEYDSEYQFRKTYPTSDTSKPPYPEAVALSYYTNFNGFTHFTFASLENNFYPNNFRAASANWPVSNAGGDYALSKQVTVYLGGRNEQIPLVRSEELQIRADDKFILNQTFARWSGSGTPWFLQLQVQDYSSPGQQNSSPSFNFCVHMIVPNVRRLSCTLHDRLTGKYRDARILDDSDNLGAIEYLPRH